jgi:ubiquinone biosynthesis protein
LSGCIFSGTVVTVTMGFVIARKTSLGLPDPVAVDRHPALRNEVPICHLTSGASYIRQPRSLQIVFAATAFAWAWWRLHNRAPERLPLLLRSTVERLGTTFVKLAQALSIRKDMLPQPYLDALSELQHHVAPFPAAQAISVIESAFGEPVTTLFASFEREPLAAASVAQIHAATMADGTAVVVKVRRPGIAAQVRTDLKLLRRLSGIGAFFLPKLRRQKPQALIDELAEQLLAEIDMRLESHNVRRLANALRDQPDVWVPEVVEPLVSEEVLVQQFSAGAPLARSFGTQAGQRLAGVLLDAYLHQLLVVGAFHGDPHPGNLFVLADGRLCFHDFGLIGTLDARGRRALALLLEAMVYQDAPGALDATIDLGFITGQVDRREYERAVDNILSEMASMPFAEWSAAEAIWRIARIGQGEHFIIPRPLLVMLRTLFLVESTLRLLNPQFNLVEALLQRRDALATALASSQGKRPQAVQVVRTVRELPRLLTEWLRQTQAEDGRPGVAIHHRGLEELEATLARTGNRLSLALVTLGLYIAASLLMLHSAGPRVWGIPLLAIVAFVLALALSVRLVRAVSTSGKL